MPRLRFLLPPLFLVAVVALAGCGGGGDGDATGDRRGDAESTESGDRADSGDHGDLECGPNDVGGVTVMKHCGPASAEVVVGGETYAFEGGSCERGDRYIAVNVGTQVLADPDAEQRYFGFSAGDIGELMGDAEGDDLSEIEPVTGDGPYADDVIATWVVGTATGALSSEGDEVSFSDGVTKGAFSGTSTFDFSGPVTGSFDCGE